MRSRKHERGAAEVEVTCMRNRKYEQDTAQGRTLNTETENINYNDDSHKSHIEAWLYQAERGRLT